MSKKKKSIRERALERWDPKPKYPKIKVQLVGEDGNAMMLLGKTRKAMRREGISGKEIEKFTEEATSGDYDKLLATVMKWVEVR